MCTNMKSEYQNGLKLNVMNVLQDYAGDTYYSVETQILSW